MLKGYWVAERRYFKSLDEYKKYAVANAAPFNKYGGKFLTRGGKSECVEGKFRSRVVLIEFPISPGALACDRSPEYAAVKKLREFRIGRGYCRAEGL